MKAEIDSVSAELFLNSTQIIYNKSYGLKNMDKFICDKCGLCCRNLNNCDIYKFLNKGNGICQYLDETTNLCSIYENRPIICNVEKSYSVFFSNNVSYEEYIKLNLKACQALKNKE